MVVEMRSDLQLVTDALNGDIHAFDALARKHYETAYRIALRYAILPEDAKDIAQEAFVTAYERLRQLSRPESFPGWLAAIVRNEALMWRRRSTAQPTLFTMDNAEPESSPRLAALSLEAARRAESRAAIREMVAEALSTLTEEQQQVVSLHYLQGYDYRETAALLNIPLAAVRGRLDRARSTLRKELREMKTASKTSWELDNEALDGIRQAAVFAWSLPGGHPILNTVLFTGDGKIVSTDTHRIFVRACAAFRDVPRVAVHADLARTLRGQFGEARRACFVLEEDKAVLRLNGEQIEAPLITGDYPDWERCVPSDWDVRATARVGDWLDALNMLTCQRESEFARTAEPPGHPRVVVTLSSRDERVTIRQGLAVGENEGIAWQSSVSFPVQTTGADSDLTIAANAVYLDQAVRGPGLPPGELIEFALNKELDPFLTRPANGPDSFILTMPMQMEPE